MNAPNKLMRRDSGIALLTTLLLMLLMSSLLVGFVLLISSGQKLSGYNNDYSKAFYAAEAGMEKLTADIGTLFDTNYSPTRRPNYGSPNDCTAPCRHQLRSIQREQRLPHQLSDRHQWKPSRHHQRD